jgi:chromosome segregation ATPase
MSGIKPAAQPLGRKQDEIRRQFGRLRLSAPERFARASGKDGGRRTMSDIAELEGRVSRALDRISDAVARMRVEGGEDLALALAAEREANAQLEARVAAIKERQETKVAGLEAEVRDLRAALLERDGQLQRMREVNEGLRQSNETLREANASGLADAALVNSAMEAEIASLRATADASRTEIDEILSRLEPLIEEHAHA